MAFSAGDECRRHIIDEQRHRGGVGIGGECQRSAGAEMFGNQRRAGVKTDVRQIEAVLCGKVRNRPREGTGLVGLERARLIRPSSLPRN